MSRAIHQPVILRFAMPGVVLAVAVLCVIPSSRLGWVGWLGGVATGVVSPVSGPVTKFSAWILPSRRAQGIELRSLETLGDESERWKQRALRAETENDRLRDMIDELAGARMLNPSAPVSPVSAPVIGRGGGSGGGTLRVRAPSEIEVGLGVVATIGAEQLLGRVDAVNAGVVDIRPITTTSSPSISGVVMLDDEARGRAACLLRPVGDGTLRGDVSTPGDAVEVFEAALRGREVRLGDPDWPESSQMLVIGTVIRVEPSPEQPLRRVITVRPGRDLRSVSSVVLRIERDAGRTGGAP